MSKKFHLEVSGRKREITEGDKKVVHCEKLFDPQTYDESVWQTLVGKEEKKKKKDGKGGKRGRKRKAPDDEEEGDEGEEGVGEGATGGGDN